MLLTMPSMSLITSPSLQSFELYYVRAHGVSIFTPESESAMSKHTQISCGNEGFVEHTR